MLSGPKMYTKKNAADGENGKFGCCQLYLAVNQVFKYAFLGYSEAY